MYDNYNYPPGADTPDAPWNQRDQEQIEVVCDTCVTLRKEIIITTDNYWIEADDEGYSETHLEDGYKDIENHYTEQHKSIPDMLAELAKYINGEIAGGSISSSRRQELKAMLDDCQGWQVDNIEIEDCNTV